MADEEMAPEEQEEPEVPVEWIDAMEETRLNMAEARETFRLLEDYNDESAWVLQNRYKGAVTKARKQCFELILKGIDDMHKQAFPPKQADSSPS
jgi:hypothetical protein